MTNDKRACIAFICGMKVNPYRKKQMVFDYSKGEYFHFLVMHRSISGIHVFDYQRNGHVKGAFDMLFDYVANYHVTIEWNKSKFQGFDYESQCYLQVRSIIKILRCLIMRTLVIFYIKCFDCFLVSTQFRASPFA